MLLLNPGPTNTHTSVKTSQTNATDTCHRAPNSIDNYQTLQEKLLRLFQPTEFDKWQVALLCGSGTTALEAMITSLIPQHSAVIIAGKYGQRAAEIMERYQINFKPIYVHSVDDLTYDPDIQSLYFVENEASTGEKFALDEITKQYPNAALYIDAITAFGATDYAPFASHIAAISFSSDKCLQAPSGLAMVIYRQQAHMNKPRSFTLDLSMYQDKIPFTIPPQLIASLKEALRIRQDNEHTFNQRQMRLIEDFEALGIKCINIQPSNTIISFQHPTRSYQSLANYLGDRNIFIYLGALNVERSFRVATMSVLFDQQYSEIMAAFKRSCQEVTLTRH